jgi:DNA-binding XRE family transcriptional regulator
MTEQERKAERRRQIQEIKKSVGPDQTARGALLPGLFACRLAVGVSQAELAEQARVARTTIRGLESGGRRAHATTLRRLSDALSVSPADLLTTESVEAAQEEE